jgi:hypothetical protein
MPPRRSVSHDPTDAASTAVGASVSQGGHSHGPSPWREVASLGESAWSRARACAWLAVSACATLTGALAGVVGSGTLGEPLGSGVHQALSLYVGGVLSQGPAAPPAEAWRTALGLGLRAAALAWMGGLFAFGWALTLPVLFAQGFAQGFALAALAGAAPATSALIALVPALAAAALLANLGAVALSLANRQLQARRGRYPPPTGATYAGYGAVLVAAGAGLAGVAALQAYTLPWAMRLLAVAGAGLALPWQL